MNCPKCNTETHIDSTGVTSCVSCGHRVEPYNNADLMKRDPEVEAKNYQNFLRGTTNDAGEKLQSVEDPVEPSHYTDLTITPLEYIEANEPEFSWCIANVIKYVSRYKRKNGIEDLRKAEWYLQHEISRLDNC